MATYAPPAIAAPSRCHGERPSVAIARSSPLARAGARASQAPTAAHTGASGKVRPARTPQPRPPSSLAAVTTPTSASATVAVSVPRANARVSHSVQRRSCHPRMPRTPPILTACTLPEARRACTLGRRRRILAGERDQNWACAAWGRHGAEACYSLRRSPWIGSPSAWLRYPRLVWRRGTFALQGKTGRKPSTETLAVRRAFA
jgi:hypothetical protein